MTQTRLASFIEANFNTFCGTLINWAATVWIVSPLYGWGVTMLSGIGVTAIYTVISIARNYAVRRLFARRLAR